MGPEVRRLTNRHATFAAIASFILQPIPAADELVVVPIHYWFVGKVARKRGVSVFKAPWRSASKIIWGGAGVRLVANFSLGLIPVAGAFSNALTAVALTEYLGRYLDAALDDPDAPAPAVSIEELKSAIKSALQKKTTKAGEATT
jgi:uncharacterized protein (DUF697 family)